MGLRSYYERGGNGLALVNSLGTRGEAVVSRITFCSATTREYVEPFALFSEGLP